MQYIDLPKNKNIFKEKYMFFKKIAKLLSAGWRHHGPVHSADWLEPDHPAASADPAASERAHLPGVHQVLFFFKLSPQQDQDCLVKQIKNQPIVSLFSSKYNIFLASS